MRILILHNAYQQAGGEDTVVASESKLLQEAGHDVEVEIVSNHDIGGFVDKAKAILSAGWNTTSAQRIERLVRDRKPDIVHIHNFFPLLSPAVHGAARAGGAAVVQTLHNYRTLCAAATFLRDGEVCRDCLDGSRWNAIKHRCYRGSAAGTAAIVRMQKVAERRQVWQKDVDCVIALTDFGRKLFTEQGFPEGKIYTKPNFVKDADAPPFVSAVPSGPALFVGRLSHEKGVLDLARAWNDIPDIPLTVIGDGPERAEMESLAPDNVTFQGAMSRPDVLHAMSQARFLLFPSRWYEGFPMIFAEAMASGLPIIAARLGAAAEVIKPEFGTHFEPGNEKDLVSAVRRMAQADLPKMRQAARSTFETQYSESENIKILETCYGKALEHRHKDAV